MSETLVATESALVGRLDGGLVRIDGRFEGDIRASGRVCIGAQARVSGTLHAPQADIAGEFLGEIRSERLAFTSSARAEGRFHSTQLRIEEGAQVDGAFNDDSEAAPAFEAPAAPAEESR